MGFPYSSPFPFPPAATQESDLLKAFENGSKGEAKSLGHVSAPEPKLVIEAPKRKMIGRLSLEERQRRIERYRAKRNTRVWVKKISYSCRKRVADLRPRVKGRFIAKNEAVVSSPQVASISESPAVAVVAPQNGAPKIMVPPATPTVPTIKEAEVKKSAKDVFCIVRNDAVPPAAVPN